MIDIVLGFHCDPELLKGLPKPDQILPRLGSPHRVILKDALELPPDLIRSFESLGTAPVSNSVNFNRETIWNEDLPFIGGVLQAEDVAGSANTQDELVSSEIGLPCSIPLRSGVPLRVRSRRMRGHVVNAVVANAYSGKMAQFLRASGAEFESLPATCEGKELPGWQTLEFRAPEVPMSPLSYENPKSCWRCGQLVRSPHRIWFAESEIKEVGQSLPEFGHLDLERAVVCDYETVQKLQAGIKTGFVFEPIFSNSSEVAARFEALMKEIEAL